MGSVSSYELARTAIKLSVIPRLPHLMRIASQNGGRAVAQAECSSRGIRGLGLILADSKSAAVLKPGGA